MSHCVIIMLNISLQVQNVGGFMCRHLRRVRHLCCGGTTWQRWQGLYYRGAYSKAIMAIITREIHKLHQVIVFQVDDCSMPLIGDQQDEDRVQIAELVVSQMNQTVPRTPSSSAVRASAGQPAQVLQG